VKTSTCSADAELWVLNNLDVAERLGFESPKIIALKEHPRAMHAQNSSENAKPLLITDGAGVEK